MTQQETKSKKINFSLVSMYHIKNFGPRYIHSFLKSKGQRVNLIFFKDSYINNAFRPTSQEIDKLTGLLKDIGTDLVGLSVSCSSYFKTASEITLAIKKRLDIPVLWGGIHPTVEPEESIQIADMVCVGEGEEPVLELLTNMAEGKDISQIKNLWVKTNGQVARNPIRPLRQDLDSLPFPDYSQENKYYLAQTKLEEGEPIYNECWDYLIKTTRGCPYQCTYCSNHLLQKIYQGKFIRQRSVANVIDELIYAKQCFGDKMRLVNFFDEVFGLSQGWLEEFREEYKKNIGLPFGLFLHPLAVKEEESAILKDAGAFGIGLGIQSGSQRIRKNIFKRPESDQQIIKAMEIVHKNHFQEVVVDLIHDNPFEDLEDKKESLKLLLKLPKPFRVLSYSLTYFPQTEIAQMALKARLITPQEVEGKNEKLLSQFIATFDYKKRSPRDIAWIALFSMTGNPFIPGVLIAFLSKRKFFMLHPGFLVLFSTLTNSLFRYLFKGGQMILTKQINLALIKKLIYRKARK